MKGKWSKFKVMVFINWQLGEKIMEKTHTQLSLDGKSDPYVRSSLPPRGNETASQHSGDEAIRTDSFPFNRLHMSKAWTDFCSR